MKNKKIFIALLLVASLALGIGYAALADQLEATASAGITKVAANDAFGENVYFANVICDTSKVDASIGADSDSHNNDKLSISVKSGVLAEAGDTITLTADIINEGDLPAYVSVQAVPTITNTSVNPEGQLLNVEEYFSITTSWATNLNPHADVVPAEGDTDITFTIHVLKTPTVDVSAKFDLLFNVTTDAP